MGLLYSGISFRGLLYSGISFRGLDFEIQPFIIALANKRLPENIALASSQPQDKSNLEVFSTIPDKSGPKICRDKFCPETCPAPRNWPLLNAPDGLTKESIKRGQLREANFSTAGNLSGPGHVLTCLRAGLVSGPDLSQGRTCPDLF